MTRVKTVIYTAIPFLILMLLAGLAFAGTGSTVGDSDPIGDILRAMFSAFRGGDYPEAGALALCAAVAAARTYGVKRYPSWGSTEGALIMALVGGFATSMVAQLAGPATLSMAAFWIAVKVAAGAAGGYAMISKLVMPILRMLQSKLPGFMSKPFGYVLDLLGVIFERSKAVTIAKAEAAGRAAVTAKPGPGASGVVGTIKDAK